MRVAVSLYEEECIQSNRHTQTLQRSDGEDVGDERKKAVCVYPGAGAHKGNIEEREDGDGETTTERESKAVVIHWPGPRSILLPGVKATSYKPTTSTFSIRCFTHRHTHTDSKKDPHSLSKCRFHIPATNTNPFWAILYSYVHDALEITTRHLHCQQHTATGPQKKKK